MTDYYVKNGGSDGLDGLSPTNAWETITKVNASMGSFAPGDNIYFNGGDTWTSPTLGITCDGTSGNQITFSTYGTGRAIFNGAAIQSTSGNGYITVDYIDCHSTAGDGIAFSKTTGWQYDVFITNCLVYDAGNVGVFLQSIDGYLIDNVECYGCYNGNIYVYGSDYPICNGTINDCESYNATQNDGISVHEGDSQEPCGSNHLIKDCLCYGNAEEGFDVSDGTDVTVQDCEAYGDVYAGYIFEGQNTVTVKRCIARDGNHGMHVGGSNVTIKNCLIYDNSYHGILVEAYSACTGLNIYNNTFAHPDSGNSGQLLCIYHDMEDINVKNNIFTTKQSTYPSNLVGIELHPTTINAVFDNNQYYHPAGESSMFYINGSSYSWTSWKSTFSQDADSQWGDPDFIDQDADDYKLLVTSPCIDEGANIGVTEDYSGYTRPEGSGYDIGAHEYGGSAMSLASEAVAHAELVDGSETTLHSHPGGGSTDLKPFKVYDSTGNQQITGTVATFNMNSTEISNANYSLASDEITLVDAGTYQVSYTIGIEQYDTSGGTRAMTNYWMESDDSGSYTEMRGSFLAIYGRETCIDEHGGNSATFLKVHTNGNKKLRIRCQKPLSTGTNVDSMAGKSSVSIIKIA